MDKKKQNCTLYFYGSVKVNRSRRLVANMCGLQIILENEIYAIYMLKNIQCQAK